MTSENAAVAAAERLTAKKFRLDRIVVAYDGSAYADNALKDAALLAGKQHSEVLIVHIEPPNCVEGDVAGNLAKASLALASNGVHSRGIHRFGSVGEMLRAVCREENVDLLMMGAYGRGRQDRETLGSTAEQLLREVTCPVITYGPRVSHSILETDRSGPALFPIAMPCNDGQIPGAIGLAKLFHSSLEVFYAVPYPAHCELKCTERECLRVTSIFRAEGVKAGWSLVYGTPDLAVWSKSTELKSPYILMPLKRRDRLSATTSDNVAAHVIRHSSVPVITYTFD